MNYVALLFSYCCLLHIYSGYELCAAIEYILSVCRLLEFFLKGYSAAIF